MIANLFLVSVGLAWIVGISLLVADWMNCRGKARRSTDHEDLHITAWTELGKGAWIATYPPGHAIPRMGERMAPGSRMVVSEIRPVRSGRVDVTYRPFDHRADLRRRWAQWAPKRPLA